tara:strand:+ start:528 stop:1124 length:597 start_codon:yes stop_codon:yes gene_type:complete
MIGIVLFLLLYLMATFSYPGGSFLAPDHHGFSFWHNYLCDLLDDYAINGEVNTARYLARGSLLALCVGLIVLWYRLPELFSPKSTNQLVMQFSGLAALFTILFLTAGTHDITIRIAGVLGVVAFATCIIALFKAHYWRHYIFGVFCFFVFMANYYIYETGIHIDSLPIIQKITFTLFLIWFLSLNLLLYRKTHNAKHI